MREKECWKDMIFDMLKRNNDTLVSWTFKDGEENVMFDSGYGGSEGIPFTAWGEKYVYFPVVYDGSEWVGSAPRNPCDETTGHQGGE